MIPAAAAAAIMDHGFLADWSAFAMTCHKVARQVAERREILLRRDPSFPDDEFFALPAVRRRLRAVLRRSLSLAVLERGIKAMSAKLGPERVETEPVYEELFVRPALVDVPQHEDPPTAELGVDDTHRFVLGVRLASGGETTLRVLRPRLYAWGDHGGEVVPKEDGTPYAFTHRGCGGCGECAACLRSLCCDGSLVAWVRPQQDSRPVHLECLATCLFVDYAPTGRATCALSGAKIDKFAVRLAVVVPKHNGEPDWGILFRLHEARAFMRALRAEPGLEHFDVADVRGVAELAPEHRDWALAALRGEGGPPSPPLTSATHLRAYTALGCFEANYPMHCMDCKPRPPKARKRDPGQKTISAFFKKAAA
ncbi:hypothetical protein SO694_00001056 [Aureococcus anophagefferens]|uniref:PARP-type domain-containing protein n=1 Tax=Aureococcus anophagefferens TaxID=44056 RepID=A0ABR1GBN3_AURAN